MKNTVEENNVIEVSFCVDHEVAHPASKNFLLKAEEEDPLDDLLSEFADDEDLPVNEKDDYIFHHQKKKDLTVSALESSEVMVQKITDQTCRLKEDIKRLKYYLNEMNIDE